jgi:hypothetical protein
MITTIAPLVLDSAASGAAAHLKTVAAPIWDIGANLKTQGITFATYILMAGTAVLAAAHFFGRNKTAAIRTAAIGIVLVGIVHAIPALGVMSKDTIGGLTHSGTR